MTEINPDVTNTRPPTKFNPISIGTALLMAKSKFYKKEIKLYSGSAHEIAEQVIYTNSQKDVLRSGENHFKLAMWVVDTALALQGGLTVIEKEKWSYWVDLIIKMSRKKDLVPTCVTATEAHDAPWARVDNLPALVYMCDVLGIVDMHRADLNRLIRVYNFEYLQNGLVNMDTAGDWKDTVHRPSSAYANIFALKMLEIAEKHRLYTNNSASYLESQIEEKLWLSDGSFRDFPGTDELGVDASVLALYLDVMPEKHQAIIARLEKEDIFDPHPLRAAVKDYAVTAPQIVPWFTKRTARNYHDLTSWPHLGMMYAISLYKFGLTERAVALYKNFSGMIEKFRTVPETLNKKGGLYSEEIVTSETGFTMGACLFVELEQLVTPRGLTLRGRGGI